MIRTTRQFNVWHGTWEDVPTDVVRAMAERYHPPARSTSSSDPYFDSSDALEANSRFVSLLESFVAPRVGMIVSHVGQRIADGRSRAACLVVLGMITVAVAALVLLFGALYPAALGIGTVRVDLVACALLSALGAIIVQSARYEEADVKEYETFYRLLERWRTQFERAGLGNGWMQNEQTWHPRQRAS